MGLEPYLLSSMAKGEEWEGMEKHRVMDCIDCGSCVFTCPAHRPLLDGIRLGKGKVGAMIRERQAAAKPLRTYIAETVCRKTCFWSFWRCCLLL